MLVQLLVEKTCRSVFVKQRKAKVDIKLENGSNALLEVVARLDQEQSPDTQEKMYNMAISLLRSDLQESFSDPMGFMYITASRFQSGERGETGLLCSLCCQHIH